MGARVLLKRPGAAGAQTFAEAWLDTSQGVLANRPELLEQWRTEGIVGRARNGRLYPKDGQRFLDELPFAYRSPYLWAEPA